MHWRQIPRIRGYGRGRRCTLCHDECLHVFAPDLADIGRMTDKLQRQAVAWVLSEWGRGFLVMGR